MNDYKVSIVSWPVAPDGTDQPTLYMDGFNFENGRAKLFH